MVKLEELLNNAVANNSEKASGKGASGCKIKPEEVNRVESMGLAAVINEEVKINKK